MDFLAAEIASKKSTLDKASKTMKKKKRKYLTAGQLRDAEEEEWKRKEDKKRKKVEEKCFQLTIDFQFEYQISHQDNTLVH